MTDAKRTPGSEDAPIESRRAGAAQPDAEQPVAPDEAPPPLDDMALGEFAAESARPTPLDDIAEAEREKMPRD